METDFPENNRGDREFMDAMTALVRTELAERGCKDFGVEVRRSAVRECLLVKISDRRNGRSVEVGGADYDAVISTSPQTLDTGQFLQRLERCKSAVGGN
ncbi:MAG: hypothetical protein LBH01_01015 [Verrucomicrobiales bacterium]|nr:hypothetical protein [Verrucomicrobiales bacterium]